MTTLIVMGIVLLVVAMSLTISLICEYFLCSAKWPLALWVILICAIFVDVHILRHKGVFFWLGLFL